VRLPWSNLDAPKRYWVTEPRQVRPGLLAARTLLPHCDRFAAIALINLSGTDQALRPGHALGSAAYCSPKAVWQYDKCVAVNEGEFEDIILPPPSDYVDDSDSDDNSVRASLVERSEACVMLNDALAEPFVGGTTLGLANCGGTNSGGTNLCGTNDVCNEETYELDGGETVVKRATVYAVRPVGVPSAEPIATNSEAADLSHIQPIVDKLPSSLTPDQRERAIELIKKKQMFSVGRNMMLAVPIF